MGWLFIMKKIDYNEIGKTIRSIRIKDGITQDQLSEFAGISPGYLSKIEGGYGRPSLEVLASVANSLGVTLDDIVYPKAAADSYDIYRKLIDNLLNDCSLSEKELIYSMIKAFIDYLADHGMRM